MKIKKQTFDIIAMSSSIICAIHCAVVPILLSFSSLGSLHFLENPYIEWSFIVAGLIFVAISLVPSYKNIHRKSGPLLLALTGFIFIAISRIDINDLWEATNTVFGAFIVAFAHYKNWKLSKCKQHSIFYSESYRK